ncbi:glycerophosphodiester phosphodiesterase family protein [Daejeonella sp.]|uniref:glycerophosphodiester phosphodiesterase n=1 Tax=Daejeonella sp. TaxID=2805397 RepID=UPI0030BA9F13
MKLKSLSILITLTIISAPSFSQSKMSVLISNHTFSPEKTEVGTLQINSAEKAVFKLKGKNAKMFIIQDNKLSIVEKHIKPDVKWYDLNIQAKTGSSKVTERFRIVNDQFIRNRVIAHRGAWKNTGAAENSIAALQHAIRLGSQGSEFDVHMSADSVLVINHDPTIQGLTIAKSSASQLGSLKLSSGENMPTLEAFLKAGLNQNNTKLVLEIKPTINNTRALQLAQKAVAMVKDLRAQAWIDYISFDYNICLEVQRLDPYARVAYLNGDKSPAVLSADKLWGFDYHFSVFQKNERWIDEAKQKGLTINAWTVNDEPLMKWFLDKKIDFITTNEPELLLRLVNK